MPAPSPYDLEPGMWRNLLARTAVFHATRTRIAELCDAQGREVQRALLDLDTWAREYAAHDVDDRTAVLNVVMAWDRELTRTLGLGQLDERDRKLLTELQELARDASWDDPFGEIFARVAALSHTIYGDTWRSVTLGVAHIGNPPRAGHDPYAVTAVTPWPPGEAGARVNLYIHADRFGPAAYAALQMVLIHECICHVGACHAEVDNGSAFAEGLLDWVAYRYQEHWAVKLDPQLAPAARMHAESLCLVLKGADSPIGWARRVGHQAAEKLRAWFETDCGQHWLESPLTVGRLAIALNKVDRKLEHKDQFVSLIGSPLPPHLAAALHAWDAGTLDATQVLDAVVTMP